MRTSWIGFAATAVLAVLEVTPMAAQDVEHAVAGVVRHVDHATKMVVVKTTDGAKRTFVYTDRTLWRGTKDVGKGSVRAGGDLEKDVRKGSHVIVHYTGAAAGTAAKDTAIEIRRADHAVLHAAKGTITAVDESARTVTLRTAKGTEQVLKFSDHTLVDTGKGVEKCTVVTAKEAGKAGKVTVHYTEEAGAKVVHVIRKAV